MFYVKFASKHITLIDPAIKIVHNSKKKKKQDKKLLILNTPKNTIRYQHILTIISRTASGLHKIDIILLLFHNNIIKNKFKHNLFINYVKTYEKNICRIFGFTQL